MWVLLRLPDSEGRGALESIILDGLGRRLMAPELVEEFIQAVHKEINSPRRENDLVRECKGRELTEVTRKLNGLIDAEPAYSNA
jgi:hypothetical protein